MASTSVDLSYKGSSRGQGEALMDCRTLPVEHVVCQKLNTSAGDVSEMSALH